MGEEQGRQIDQQFVREFLDRLRVAINSQDADRLASLCTEDVVWEDPGAPEPLRGREAFRDYHRKVLFRAFPDAQVELVDGPYVSLNGTKAAARWRFVGTMLGPVEPPGYAPTGTRIAFETAEFYEFRDGLLSRGAVVMDMLGVGRQIGLIPKPGSFSERIGIFLQRLAARRRRSRRAEGSR